VSFCRMPLRNWKCPKRKFHKLWLNLYEMGKSKILSACV
jgi:hypothetical protein